MNTLPSDDTFYMQQALREAQMAADEDEVPIGAVIVSNGRIIARAHNQTECLGDATAHAEMLAFTAASDALGGKYMNDCTLYVTVEPCPMCAGAAGWTQMGRIVYGASDPKRGYSLLTGTLLHPRTEVLAGVLGDECGALVKSFFKKKRR